MIAITKLGIKIICVRCGKEKNIPAPFALFPKMPDNIAGMDLSPRLEYDAVCSDCIIKIAIDPNSNIARHGPVSPPKI